MEADLFLNSTISESSMVGKLLLKLRVSENTPNKFRPLSYLSLSLSIILISIPQITVSLVGTGERNKKYAGKIPVSLQAQVELGVYENIMQM